MTLGDLQDIITNGKPEGMSWDEWFAMPVMIGQTEMQLKELEWESVGAVEADVKLADEEDEAAIPMNVFAMVMEGSFQDDEEDFFDPRLN